MNEELKPTEAELGTLYRIWGSDSMPESIGILRSFAAASRPSSPEPTAEPSVAILMAFESGKKAGLEEAAKVAESYTQYSVAGAIASSIRSRRSLASLTPSMEKK